MLEQLYFLFNNPDSEYWDLWVYQRGYLIGFLTLLFVSVSVVALYYVVIGRATDSFSKIGHWLFFMFINSVLIFVINLFLISSNVFESVDGIPEDVIIFSLINGTVYAIVFYFILSLIFNNLSLHARFIPFDIFKK